eukprot:2585631-Amphidinium_carterae.2
MSTGSVTTPPAKETKTALEVAWKTHQSTQKAPRSVQESKVAEQVRHAIQDACAWATALELDGTLSSEGLTLRQTIWRDKLLASQGHSIAFGKLYYKDLRQIFSSRDKLESQLNEMVSDTYMSGSQLLLAVAGCIRHNPNRSWLKEKITPHWTHSRKTLSICFLH